MGSESKLKENTHKKLSKNQLKKMDFNTKIAPYMKVGLIIAFVISMYEMWSENYFYYMFNTSFVSSKFFWFMIFSLSISHIIYYIIWHFPRTYMRICSNPCIHPVDLTFSFVIIGKVLQLIICFSWYLYINNFFLDESSHFPVSFGKIVSSVFCIICGQWLNSAVWNTLGVNGVCYGFKLGRPVPWITGFPFNIGVSNPQYVGSVITDFGVITLLINPITAEAGILYVFFFITVFYAFSAYIETYTGKVQGKIK